MRKFSSLCWCHWLSHFSVHRFDSTVSPRTIVSLNECVCNQTIKHLFNYHPDDQTHVSTSTLLTCFSLLFGFDSKCETRCIANQCKDVWCILWSWYRETLCWRSKKCHHVFRFQNCSRIFEVFQFRRRCGFRLKWLNIGRRRRTLVPGRVLPFMFVVWKDEGISHLTISSMCIEEMKCIECINY